MDAGPPETKKCNVDGQKYTPNPYIDTMESDFMYHIGYSRQDCLEMFGDVKVVKLVVLLTVMFIIVRK